MSQHYSDPKREDDAHALPNVEVFHLSAQDIARMQADAIAQGGTGEDCVSAPGWYYWYCFPGCMPDGEPNGPYESEQAAIDAMRDDADNGDDDEN